MNKYVLLFLFAVLLSSFGQLLLKKGAAREEESLWKQYANPYVISGYVLFFGALAVNAVAYRGVPLKTGPVLDAAGFFFVPCLSWFFFKETITRKKAAGFLLIFAGIAVSVL